eukprot:EG_transcript_14891
MATRVAKQRNTTLRVFYHTSTWKQYWQDVITEQVLMMDGRRPVNFFHGEHPFDQSIDPCPNCSVHGGLRWLPAQWASVLDLADQLYLNVAHQRRGDFERVKQMVDRLPLKHRDKLYLHFNLTIARRDTQRRPKASLGLSVGEVSTMIAMHDYCIAERAAGRKAFVLYLHTKGSCCSRRAPSSSAPEPKSTGRSGTVKDPVSVASWRELMNTFSIEFPSICLRALLEGYVACGTNLRHWAEAGMDPHYSGTVFWANCDHLAALPPLRNRFNAWDSELWLFRVSRRSAAKVLFAFNCAFNTHSCRENLYKRPCPRASYRAKVLAYLQHWELPLSDMATRDITPAWVRQRCHPLFAQPYPAAAFWDNLS